MALAEYYRRATLAAAQVLEGFDEGRFEQTLEGVTIGIAFDERGADGEGEALLDLAVRLLARVYPSIAVIGPAPQQSQLSELARRINPGIEIGSEAEIGISIGGQVRPFATTIYAGSSGWDALIDDERPQPLGNSGNPLGAGVSACLAAAALFRELFLGPGYLDRGLRFSALHQDRVDRPTRGPRRSLTLEGDAALIGVGAIGNAAVWALGRAQLEGRLHLVDHEEIELSNIQRYVLAERSDEGKEKVSVVRDSARGPLELVPHRQTLADFLATDGYGWPYFLLALDSAADRRSAQAALPRWIANAWTQPGDLGSSVHSPFGSDGACVACLYLPTAPARNEDELVAETLRVPQFQQHIRTLLHTNGPTDRGLLDAIAAAIGRPVEALLPFEGRPVRDLYVGFCGGAVIPVSEAGRPPQDLHVPLAHQSALAGLLLAASLLGSTRGADPAVTRVSRVNVLRAVGEDLARPMPAVRDGRCLCDDLDFVAAYERKY